jgi:DegV family protein with EDD domain
MSIRIVTDSTCDLPQDVVQKYGIRVVPMYIHIHGESYLDGVDITREEFYRRLPELDPAPTTAAPGPKMFRQIYEELAQEGATEVLSIHISVSLSAVLDVAKLAAEETTSVRVTVMDSRQLSLGTGFLVETAAVAAAQGKSMDEILAILEEQISRTHVFAVLDTMEFLRRSGRISGLVAGFGSLLQVKPLLRMYEGDPTSERVRTTNGAFSRLESLLVERAPFKQVALVHTHAGEQAELLKQRVEHLLPQGDLISVDITPVIGAHIGPGAVGFACISA